MDVGASGAAAAIDLGGDEKGGDNSAVSEEQMRTSHREGKGAIPKTVVKRLEEKGAIPKSVEKTLEWRDPVYRSRIEIERCYTGQPKNNKNNCIPPIFNRDKIDQYQPEKKWDPYMRKQNSILSSSRPTSVGDTNGTRKLRFTLRQCPKSTTWKITKGTMTEISKWEDRYTKLFDAMDLVTELRKDCRNPNQPLPTTSTCLYQPNMPLPSITIEEPYLVLNDQIENLTDLIKYLKSKIESSSQPEFQTCNVEKRCENWRRLPAEDFIKYIELDAKTVCHSWTESFHDRCIRFGDKVKLHLPRGIHLWNKQNWDIHEGYLTLTHDCGTEEC